MLPMSRYKLKVTRPASTMHSKKLECAVSDSGCSNLLNDHGGPNFITDYCKRAKQIYQIL